MTVEIDGANNIVKTNTISEVTSANGVTVDGLNIKDSKLVTADSVITTNVTDANITSAKINNDLISGKTALASEPADTDEFLVSDGGTLKRIDYSLIKGSGKLKQVQFTNFDSNTSITSIGSQTATYLTDQITPSASSSKVEVIMDVIYQIASSDPDGRYQAAWRIFRSINGGTYSGVYPENDDTNIAYGYDEQDSTYFQNHLGITFMDAPNTTNTVDYKLYVTLQEGNDINVGKNMYSQISLKEYLQND